MLEILFGSPKEARTMYSIFRSISETALSELQLVNNQCIKITPKSWDITLEQFVIPGLTQFIICHKEQHLIMNMLKELYYFSDEEEQQQILHITQSIIEGEREEIPNVQKLAPREHFVKEALEEFLRPDLYFTYSSFQKFRLQKYLSSLRDYVEIAIEEYKMEQEYQNFIQSLREYLCENESKIPRVHLVYDKEYVIYNENKCLISDEDLKTLIDKEFVYKHPMYIDTKLLAPLVSMVPVKIYLYANDYLDGMIQTILNIFEERVTIHRLEDFYN
ncbi:putative sporulation protein YtxC [Metabacillus halosaccharovorans]|uniref:putative sporulation protein YtxC n=1 Tax=Metabacillus halosaccharovorans TaxID=930124 RepID=UPI001C1F9EF5|nr:putative sporulation protein YtxC [Metabacillus halosaccharovorans]MBU7593808.1 putative sporulation protein YtxC [Metabacillus halosaccharovorans]